MHTTQAPKSLVLATYGQTSTRYRLQATPTQDGQLWHVALVYNPTGNQTPAGCVVLGPHAGECPQTALLLPPGHARALRSVRATWHTLPMGPQMAVAQAIRRALPCL